MKGDFSVLNFDPREHDRGVQTPADGVLRNLGAVLFQQGRVVTDADQTEGELLDLGWQNQAARDVIGAGICAVPAEEPDGFRVAAARVDGSDVVVDLVAGRCWADGILTRLAGDPAPEKLIGRRATYLGPPVANPTPIVGTIGDNIRDAVILEVSYDAVHALQYPERLLEPALGGPDTAERAYVNWRLRLFRLADGEDCKSIAGRLRDDPTVKGHLSVSLSPVVALAGDCPVVGGGGYTGFEHALYRVEIADTRPGDPVRFKWSMWNGGLAGRGRFDATVNPNLVLIDAGRTPIITSGVTDFYLEALQFDVLDGTWSVVYASQATLNTNHDLELATPAAFGTLPATTDPIFFRLWNGVGRITDFTNSGSPVELRDGIRLVFDAPAAGTYQAGDYWTFKVRAGEIPNPQILIDHMAPTGIVLHRVALAEIDWTAQRDTTLSGVIEDCRRRFRPLTNQKICCTYLIGDGLSSFGDFNSLEEAAAHLPAAGGELCLLPGIHRANLRLTGKKNIKIHGCTRRSTVLPRIATRTQPILAFMDCDGIEICDLDLITYDGIAILAEGSREDGCSNLRIHGNRMIARSNVIRLDNAAEVIITDNRLHLLDTVDGLANISISADDVLVERNTLVLLPFVDDTPDDGDTPDDNPTRDPADPCARPQILYLFPVYILLYAVRVWTLLLPKLVPLQPYRALGGIHIRHGSERVRLLENRIIGGAGNGVVLGGDIDPPPPPTQEPGPSPVVNIAGNEPFIAMVQNEGNQQLGNVGVYLDAQETSYGQSDAQGMVSIKARQGNNRISVAPEYRISRVVEARERGRLVNVIVVAPKADGFAGRGFLHEVTIEGNDISMMGLSGIGFALRRGENPANPVPEIPQNDPRAALLLFLDLVVTSMTLTPILRSCDMVRDLVILNNRIHNNLRNPFTEAMLKTAQDIGRGGISLGVVEQAMISGNHIDDNGMSAADPVCGVFVGYGNDIEFTDNVLAANGAAVGGFDGNVRAGIRGGLYVRFAGALTTRLSTSSGRKPALRVHDNRIDQPAGRALTAGAYGPVSIANNHLNSEFTGLFRLFDTLVGSLMVLNLGGLHRLLALLFAPWLRRNSDVAEAESALPGGETMIADNYVRLGIPNRSLMSQVVMSFDDVGFASNTSSVYRADPFFANALVVSDTLRATANRFREEAQRTISLLSQSLRMNMTTMNQADHCIVAKPNANANNTLPTVDRPNQVLNAEACSRFNENPEVLEFFLEVLRARAGELGGNLQTGDFTAADQVSITRGIPAKAISATKENQAAITKAYQFEAARLVSKHGPSNLLAMDLTTQAKASGQATILLEQSAETFVLKPQSGRADEASLNIRVANDRGQGLGDHTLELVRANGTVVETAGRSNDSGFVTAVFTEQRTAELAKEGQLFVRVRDANGLEVLLDKEPLSLSANVNVNRALAIPLQVVPRSVVQTGTVIFPNKEPAPKIRTSLDRLDINDATKKQLREGGVADVEAILETSSEILAKLLGSPEQAETMIAMAKRLLSGGDGDQGLDALGLEPDLRKLVESTGIRTIKELAGANVRVVAKAVGDMALADSLIAKAREFIGFPPSPPVKTGGSIKRKGTA